VPILGETPTALTDKSSPAVPGTIACRQLSGSRRRAPRLSSHLHLSRAASKYQPSTTSAICLWIGRARHSIATHRFTITSDYQLPSLCARPDSPAHAERLDAARHHHHPKRTAHDSHDPNGGAYTAMRDFHCHTCPGASYASLVTPGKHRFALNQWIDTGAICAPATVRIGRFDGSHHGTEHHAGAWSVQYRFLARQRLPEVGGLREDAMLSFPPGVLQRPEPPAILESRHVLWARRPSA